MSFLTRLKGGFRRASGQQVAEPPPEQESTITLKAEREASTGRFIVSVEELANVEILTKEGYYIRVWTEWDPSTTMIRIDGNGPLARPPRGRKRISLREFMWREEYSAARD